ncbi:MAG: dihydropyrimidinase [Kosmotogales bacterium]|nr:dihydropyrimidinase [Kosmotogales bacterium]
MYNLGILNGNICDGFNIYKSNVFIKNGKIDCISDRIFESDKIIDAENKFVTPGFVDPHVHFGLKLGKYTSADDFYSGSKAALSGGVTTVIDFLEPASTIDELHRNFETRRDFANDSMIDFAFHSCIGGSPAFSAEECIEHSVKIGCPSIKIFTTYSDSNRMTEDGFLNSMLRQSKKNGVVILSHSENDSIIREIAKNYKKPVYSDLSDLRPSISEIEAVMRVSLFSILNDGQLYIVHVSSGESIEMVQKILKKHKNVKIESCPQYFYFTKNLVKSKKGYLYTYCPPARSARESEILAYELKNGNIDSIGTDHCPFMKSEKIENKDDYLKMPNGIPSLGLTFSLINTLNRNMIQSVRLMSVNPAKIFGLYPEKGTLLPGTDADITIIDDEKQFIVGNAPGNCDYSPYEGIDVNGKVEKTIIHGKIAYENDKIFVKKGEGKFIHRNPIVWG